jgi:hydroxymethylglutaryl-CoA synthase
MFSLQLRETKHPFSLSNIAQVMDVAEKLKSRQEVLIHKRLVKYESINHMFMSFDIKLNI